MMRRLALPIAIFWICLISYSPASQAQQKEKPADLVNPLLGTATLWDSAGIGYKPTHRTWGAEVFPGSSLPNAMVQLSPVTQFHSGSGYQYEDTLIYGFIHTSKGHWNLGYVPFLPVTGPVSPGNYASTYHHEHETAHPGYYQVYLDRYGINVELTSTLRCAYHRYFFPAGAAAEVIADLSKSNEHVVAWNIERSGDNCFTGFQQAGEKIYFYAVANRKLLSVDSVQGDGRTVPVLHFADAAGPLELKIGFSFVSVANAANNLKAEMLGKTFVQTRQAATDTWNALLSRVSVTGGTEKERGLFYSCLYRSFLWPALRSDVNGDFTDLAKKVVNKGFNYYTEPSLWDDYRNKLELLGLLSPQVETDVIRSLIDKGEVTGFMPTFFHGDHAAPFIAGAYNRGIRNYDVKEAYRLLLRNATVEGGTRPYITEYNDKGYVSTPDIALPEVETKAKAGVTKTLEYAYDDYAVAQLAKALGDTGNYRMLMGRTENYKNVFNPATRFMQGRLANGDWVKHFDPEFPYYEYMYREANAWQSSFFAPQDVNGLVALYGGQAGLENKLDSLFSLPWDGVEAYNISGFIGQYCQGNQPDHSVPYMYYFAGKQEKGQVILDSIMHHFYGMGKEGLAYAGMDDAGEMSSWYVFNAMGFYPFSPADARYIVSVPIFQRVTLRSGSGKDFTVIREGRGRKIAGITVGGEAVNDYFVDDQAIKEGRTMVVKTNTNHSSASNSSITGVKGKEVVLRSPDGQLKVTLTLADKIYYSISAGEKDLLTMAHLGLTCNDEALGLNPRLVSVKNGHGGETITPYVGLKFSNVKSIYNSTLLKFKGDYAVEFRAFDDGIAYRFITSKKQELEVDSEDLSINFPNDYELTLQQTGDFRTAYEEAYTHIASSAWRPADKMSTLPVLIDTRDKYKILISESDLTDYPAMFLKGNGNNGAAAVFSKTPLEFGPDGDRSLRILKAADYIAKTAGTRNFPWRYFVITKDDRQLLENTMTLRLAEKPVIGDASWIKPGQASWEWWNEASPYGPDVNFVSGVNLDTYKYYIDFAAKYGVRYIVMDEGWAKSTTDPYTPNPDVNLQELIQYGKQKNVGIVLWLTWLTVHNNMGLFKTFHDWGIKGVKIDFMNRSDQWMVNYYEEVVKEAAKYQIFVDFHGAFKPAGLEYKYPNLISYEGVRGLEQMSGCTPDNSTYLPFVRNAVGPMDFTPGAMINMQPDVYRAERPNAAAVGTRVNQLALYVVFESGLQMLCDNPTLYYRNPDCTEFITSVPTTWDETKALAAEAGELAVVAKRKGEQWFIGGITNNREQTRKMELNFDFLESGKTYTMTWFEDGINAGRQGMDYLRKTTQVKAGDKMTITMVRNGGFAAVLKP